MYKRFFFLVLFIFVGSCFGAESEEKYLNQQSRKELLVTCRRLIATLQQVDQKMCNEIAPALVQAEERRIKKEKQIRYLRSLEGWLFHKKGAGVWLGLFLSYVAYKRGMFDWVSRYEQQLKKVLRAKLKRVIRKKKSISLF